MLTSLKTTNDEPLYRNWWIANLTTHLPKDTIWNFFDKPSVWTNQCDQNHHPLITTLTLIMVVIRSKSPLTINFHPCWATQVLLNFDFVVLGRDNRLPTRSFPQILWYKDHPHKPKNINMMTTFLHSNSDKSFTPQNYLEFQQSNELALELPLPYYAELTCRSNYWSSEQYP